MDFNYIGWIPCINGHLNFGLTKPGIVGGFTNTKDIKVIDGKKTSINYAYNDKRADHHARRVMIQSEVDWKDSKGSDYDGKFRVFFQAELPRSTCFNKRSLHGRMYIYLCNRDPEDFSERHELTQFKEIRSAKEMLESDEGFLKKQVALNRHYEGLQKSLGSLGDVYMVDFFVESNGLIYLKYNPSQKDIDVDEQYIVVRQAYYYLKYSLHEHKHHDIKMDSLMTIVPFKNFSCEKKESGLRLLGQLKRELTSIKRTQSIGDSSEVGDPAGILSYMNSLINTLGLKGFLSRSDCEIESQYLHAVRTSFEAQEIRSSRKKEIELSTKTEYRVYFGWLLAMISLASILLLKTYLDIPAKESIPVGFSLWESAGIFTALILVLLTMYYFLLKNRIKRNTDKGFTEWIDSNYLVPNSNFWRKIAFRFLVSLVSLSLGLAVIVYDVDLIGLF